jgi:SAM-dependent methyltransferase
VTDANRMYGALAEWWHILSPPSGYAEEAAIYAREMRSRARRPLRSILEIGSGGGNNASHMKAWFEMTLVDVAPMMVEQSRLLNPELTHVVGDMRSVRLGRDFDGVFVHDAITYMTNREDLERAVETAYVHTRPGGVALFAPDSVTETFRPDTSHGGSDASDRALRYLEWSWDPDPSDTSHLTDYIIIMRMPDGSVRIEHDRHVQGLFSRATWLDVLGSAGFEPHRVPVEHSELEPGTYELFVGVKP